MQAVELYAKDRTGSGRGSERARQRDGSGSIRTVAKMLQFSVLAGLPRTEPQVKPNLGAFITIIDYPGRILLMDEPFAALDAQTREFMQAELLRIWSHAGKTVLFVTHQIDEAAFLADRVLVFGTRPGRLKQEFAAPFERPRALALHVASART